MSKISSKRTFAILATLLGVGSSPVSSTALAQLNVTNLSSAPRHETPVPYAGVRNWHVTQNLGPTGVRFWVVGERGDTRDSREVLVKSIEPGSPADGVLQRYDIIIGAATPPETPSTEWHAAPPLEKFTTDARLCLARAITWAESTAGQGQLKLLVRRAGQDVPVTLQLPVMGDYSATAPYDCPKTALIVKNAATFLGGNMPADGYADLPGVMNTMLLYATGDDRYLDHVRRTACRLSINDTINDEGHETWRWGYQNLFLTEYYLATGDKRVLPTIAEYCKLLAEGQCNPGTWGHKVVPDRIPPGYGSMNQSGLICFMSMVLARQAGVYVDEQALANSIAFYGSFAGRGGVPYGDHPPHADSTSNGKNGSAAVVFGQLDAGPVSQWFARLCASANLASFEGGHTGNFFNQTWSPLGASLAGRENYGRFWSRFNSYRDLARRADGSLVTQPLPHRREGDLSTGNYVQSGPMWSTGAFALSYLAGNQRLAILGRRDSVFAPNPPDQLLPALEHYDNKRFDACRQAAGAFVGAEDARLRALARQLSDAAQRNMQSLDLTLADMRRNLDAGDLYTLKAQLQAIESIIDPEDARLKDFRAALADPATEPALAAGAQYHALIGGPQWSGSDGFRVYARRAQTDPKVRLELTKLADTAPGGYRALARAYLDAHPAIKLVPDQPLFDPAAKAWTLSPAPVDGWNAPAFDDSAWQSVALPSDAVAGKGPVYLRRTFDIADPGAIDELALGYVIQGKMVVYLNGTRIFEGCNMGWWKNMIMPLTPATRELLKPGRNCLAIMLTPAEGDEEFAASLNASMKQAGHSAD